MRDAGAIDLIGVIGGLLIVAIVLRDVFETIVLPRRVTRRFRLTRLFFRGTWTPWSKLADQFHGARRETLLSYFGPISLILLLGTWATLIIVGYACLQWGLGTELSRPEGFYGFGADLYYSGTTFFTLGMGDIVPLGATARIATVVEAGTGFGLLGLVIGYLPTLYQAFSRRESTIALLDARGGSPPSAVEILRRYQADGDIQDLNHLLRTFETWAADVLESHSSYPVLAYFRSQHDHQSWVAALTAVLDTCALVMVGVDGVSARTARWTYALASHVAVDLSQTFAHRPAQLRLDRLSTPQLERLHQLLASAGVPLRSGEGTEERLAVLRAAYEPYLETLAETLRMPLPGWLPNESALDDWQSSAWELSSALPGTDRSRGSAERSITR